MPEATLALALAVVKNEATLDNIIDSDLTSCELDGLSDLFSAAVKCRRKIFAEARKQGRSFRWMRTSFARCDNDHQTTANTT